MDVHEIPAPNFNVDYGTILPIQQKRTIAFVNNFVMNTVSFLNHFAQSCESRLMEFECKVQKVEASLSILESQLASIRGIDDEKETPTPTGAEPNLSNSSLELPSIVPEPAGQNDIVDTSSTNSAVNGGVVASRDPRFEHFFKMVQVGVPAQAVKNKMVIEGVDPKILDKPNQVIPEDS